MQLGLNFPPQPLQQTKALHLTAPQRWIWFQQLATVLEFFRTLQFLQVQRLLFLLLSARERRVQFVLYAEITLIVLPLRSAIFCGLVNPFLLEQQDPQPSQIPVEKYKNMVAASTDLSYLVQPTLQQMLSLSFNHLETLREQP